MQQVLNSQERNQAFLKFLLFFVVTVALIIWAIFYNFKMPLRENAMLASEVEVERITEANQQKFVGRMDEAIALLDSLDRKDVNFEQIYLQLNSRISDLNTLQQKDNSPYGRMNKVIVDRLSLLQQNKKALREADGNAAKIQGLQAELDRTKSDVRDLNAQLAAYKRPGGF